MKIITLIVVILAMAMPVMAADVVLAWDANTETDLAGYNIHRSNTSSGPYDQIGTTDVTTFSDENILPGDWYYVVTAYNTHGRESGYSNEVMSGQPGVPGGLKISITVIVNLGD